MLPRVRELERRFGDSLVAIGVHAGKYVEERKTASIASACLRLGVHHPVVNDRQFRTWRAYAVQAWPTLAIVDPDGYLVARQAGELPLDPLVAFVELLLADSTAARTSRPPFDLARPPREPDTGPLRFPGKVLAAGGRLFVSDTGHHRILELALEGPDDARVVRTIGSGEPALVDGGPDTAAFQEPQGLALGQGELFVADRGNHAVRRVDLEAGSVETLGGTGELGGRLSAGPAREIALRSPWDLVLVGRTLYIAMAGSHQIWKLDLAVGVLRPHAGSGAEAIDDGPLERATLAQPSGLAVADGRLYFADAESSAIRWADTKDGGRVGTLVGTGLFDFGDRDGTGDEARLQHPLGVAWDGGRLVVADSYNGKLKVVDPASRACSTFDVTIEEDGPGAPRRATGEEGPGVSGRATGEDGAGAPGRATGENAPPFTEPGGLSAGEDTIYVADAGRHRVVRVPREGGIARPLRIGPAAVQPRAEV